MSAATLPDTILARVQAGVARVAGVARSAIMTAYRAAQRAVYGDAAEVVGFWRRSTLSRTTCATCWAMHGRVYKVDEPFVSHANCKCVLVPIRRGERPPETGPERFAALSAAAQREILGPARHDLYRAGKLDLGDIAVEVVDPKYGAILRQRTLAELTREAR